MTIELERRLVVFDDPAEGDLLATIAREHGAGIEPVRVRVEPVTAAFVIAAATVAAGIVTEFYERRQGGQVIDLRPGASRAVYRDRGVTFGLIVILTQDGAVTVEVYDPSNAFLDVARDVVQALTSIAATEAKNAIEAATEVTGDRGTVTRDDPGGSLPPNPQNPPA